MDVFFGSLRKFPFTFRMYQKLILIHAVDDLFHKIKHLVPILGLRRSLHSLRISSSMRGEYALHIVCLPGIPYY